jgi:hypothetical protein
MMKFLIAAATIGLTLALPAASVALPVAKVTTKSISAQGRIVSWGHDGFGQVSLTPPGNDFVAVACGAHHSIALRADGSLVSWGYDSFGQVSATPLGNDFLAVAAGHSHSVALRSNGSVVAWGRHQFDTSVGHLGAVVFTAISAGGDDVAAITSSSQLATWVFVPEPTGPPDGKDFVAVSAGYLHRVALRSDCSIVSWSRDDDFGQVSATPTESNFAAVSAGFWHSSALRSDGSLVSWGNNNHDAVSATPPGNDFVKVVAGFYRGIALRSDGSLVAWGRDDFGATSATPGGRRFITMSIGNVHGSAIRSDGSPMEMILELKAAVQTLVDIGVSLPADGQSLQATLDAALAAVERGDSPAAIGSLGAFINQAEGFVQIGKLTSTQGQALVVEAQSIIDALFPGLPLPSVLLNHL